MTYLFLSGAFLAIAAIAGILMTRKVSGSLFSWTGVAIAGCALFILTAIFDSLMIGFDLFHYEPALISGVFIGLAPIEDFAYPLATILALPPLWALLTSPDTVSMYSLVRHGFWVSRPVSWINTAFPFAAAYFLAAGSVDWVLMVGAFYYLIPYNLAMYGVNDVFDYESDMANPRKGSIEGALLPPDYHRPLLWLVTMSNLPFLTLLVAVGSLNSVLLIALSTFLMVAYSVPKLRFKERAIIDSITSSAHFVTPAIVGLMLAEATFSLELLLIIGAFFAWGVAAHAFGAVQDIGPDRQAGIGSIATVFGAKWTVRFALLLWVTGGLLLLFIPWPGNLAAVLVAPYLLNCAAYINVSDADAGSTNRAWRRFIWLNYLTGFFVTMIMIASVA